ncbi:MAG: hypothetical protein JW774_00790, partial [Candidatus Aureabacteria bacterium]|nr:hypothetical protein [Candidatus Auribacterota bacterium]
PIKIKVFGCSTGQEALSYAFELLDLGINHFTILASDIDANVLAEAGQMIYSEDKFQTMPLMKKKKLLENYFEKTEERNYQVRFKKFLTERIHFIVQDITQPLAPQSDNDFNPPYDLVSVKNILLYLDREVIQPTFMNLKSITGQNGILIVKDKYHNISRYLDNILNDFIGLSSFIAIHPAKKKTADLLNLLELFTSPQPPHMSYFFYKYGKSHHHPALVSRLEKKASSLSPWNLDVQRILFESMLSQKNSEKAKSILNQICLCDPLYFFPLYMEYKNVFRNDAYSTDSTYAKASEFGHFLSTNDLGAKSETILEKDILAWASNQTLPVDLSLALAQILTARDLGRYPRISPSPDRKWIRLGIKILDSQMNKNFKLALLEHKAQLTDHLLHFFGKEILKEKRNRLIHEVLDPLLKVSNDLVSLSGRLSMERLCSYLINSISQDDPEMACTYMDFIFSSKALSEEELDLLSDRDYSDHFEIQGNAHYMSTLLKKKSLSFEETKKHLLYALTAIDQALGVDTVYGYHLVQSRKRIMEQLDEMEKTGKK